MSLRRLADENSTPIFDADSKHLEDSERDTAEIVGLINSPDQDRKNGVLADDPDQLLGVHDSNHRIHRSASFDNSRRKWLVWTFFSLFLISSISLGLYFGMSSGAKGSDNNAVPMEPIATTSHPTNNSFVKAGNSKMRLPQTSWPTSAPTKHINSACTDTGYFPTNSDNFPQDGRGLKILVGFNNVTSNFMVHWEHNSSPDQLTITDTCSGNELFTTGMVPNGGYHLVTNNTCSVIEAKMKSPPNSGWDFFIYCSTPFPTSSPKSISTAAPIL